MDSFFSNHPAEDSPDEAILAGGTAGKEESPELVCPNCGMAVMGKDHFCMGCGLCVTPVDHKTYERMRAKERAAADGAKNAAGNENAVDARLKKLEDRFVGPNKNILYLRDDEEIGKEEEEDEDEYGRQPIPDSRRQKDPFPVKYVVIGVIAVILLIVIVCVILNI